MEVEKFLHMAGGAGDGSYATNSKVQEKIILLTKLMLEEAVEEVQQNLLSGKMVVADLGCSSGPNTFLVLSEVVKIIGKQCQNLGLQPPELQLFLNDLPGNDFNNLFQLLDYFEERLREVLVRVPCYVAGLPGSFYRRLFPGNSVHLFHSSCAIHYMSQVPEGLENKREEVPPNEGNLCTGKTISPFVVKLYQEQFKKDFSLFLMLRFNELVAGGRMVLSFPGRKNNKDVAYNEESNTAFEVLSESLNSMVTEGLVKKEKLDSFNLPIYPPSMEEVKDVINAQELFNITRVQMFDLNYDPYDDFDHDMVTNKIQSGQNVAKWIRAALEPMIASHFGDAIVDELFSRFATNVAIHLAKKKIKFPVLALSLKKKERM